MVWNKNIPEGTEGVNLGAGRIRELKEDIENILKQEHHFVIDGNQLKIYHKFSILTTAQENTTKNGQIWFNNELKQFSYKKGNQVYRNARYLPRNFSMLVLKMPLNNFWELVNLVDGYVLGVDNNIRINSTGKNFWEIRHTHTLSTESDIHTHELNIHVKEASGTLKSISLSTGTKTFSENKKIHHTNFSTNVSIETQHSHVVTEFVYQPSYYKCFFVRRK